MKNVSIFNGFIFGLLLLINTSVLAERKHSHHENAHSFKQHHYQQLSYSLNSLYRYPQG